MKRVYKYPIEICEEVKVMMPKGARVLSVQVQNGMPCLWAAVDSNEMDLEERLFHIVGTGLPIQHDVEDDSVDGFIGTIQLLDGRIVIHVFEMKRL